MKKSLHITRRLITAVIASVYLCTLLGIHNSLSSSPIETTNTTITFSHAATVNGPNGTGYRIYFYHGMSDIKNFFANVTDKHGNVARPIFFDDINEERLPLVIASDGYKWFNFYSSHSYFLPDSPGWGYIDVSGDAAYIDFIEFKENFNDCFFEDTGDDKCDHCGKQEEQHCYDWKDEAENGSCDTCNESYSAHTHCYDWADVTGGSCNNCGQNQMAHECGYNFNGIPTPDLLCDLCYICDSFVDMSSDGVCDICFHNSFSHHGEEDSTCIGFKDEWDNSVPCEDCNLSIRDYYYFLDVYCEQVFYGPDGQCDNCFEKGYGVGISREYHCDVGGFVDIISDGKCDNCGEAHQVITAAEIPRIDLLENPEIYFYNGEWYTDKETTKLAEFPHWTDSGNYAADYTPGAKNETEQTLSIYSAAEFALFAHEIYDYYIIHGNSGVYEGWTILLENDIDLSGLYWSPLNLPELVFDGQGHTISGLYVINESYYHHGAVYCAGMFGTLERTVIRNVTFDNPVVNIKSRIGRHQDSGRHFSIGTVAGYSEGAQIREITLNNPIVRIYDVDPTAFLGGVVGFVRSSDTPNSAGLNMGIVNGITVNGGEVAITGRYGAVDFDTFHTWRTVAYLGGAVGANYDSVIANAAVYGTLITTTDEYSKLDEGFWYDDPLVMVDYISAGGIAGYTSAIAEPRRGDVSCLLNNLSMAVIDIPDISTFSRRNTSNETERYVGGVCGWVYEDSAVNNLYIGNLTDIFGFEDVKDPAYIVSHNYIYSDVAEAFKPLNNLYDGSIGYADVIEALNDLENFDNGGFKVTADVVNRDTFMYGTATYGIIKSLTTLKTWEIGEGKPVFADFYSHTLPLIVSEGEDLILNDDIIHTIGVSPLASIDLGIEIFPDYLISEHVLSDLGSIEYNWYRKGKSDAEFTLIKTLFSSIEPEPRFTESLAAGIYEYKCVLTLKLNNGSLISTFTNPGKDGVFETLPVTVIVNYVEIVSALPSGEVGVNYYESLNALGDPDIAWSFVSGSLPPGLEFDEDTATFSGTPSLEGDFTFIIKAENEYGYGEKEFTVSIASAPPVTTTTTSTTPTTTTTPTPTTTTTPTPTTTTTPTPTTTTTPTATTTITPTATTATTPAVTTTTTPITTTTTTTTTTPAATTATTPTTATTTTPAVTTTTTPSMTTATTTTPITTTTSPTTTTTTTTPTTTTIPVTATTTTTAGDIPDFGIFKILSPDVPGSPGIYVSLAGREILLFAPIGTETWTLINLTLCVFGVIFAAVAVIREFRKNRLELAEFKTGQWENNIEAYYRFEELEQDRRRRVVWLMTASVMGIAGVFLFLLTQKTDTVLALFDFWTFVHAVIIVSELAAVILIKQIKSRGSDYQVIRGKQRT